MPEQRYSLIKGFIYQKLEKDIVIFDAENSTLFTFNESSALIFESLKKGKSEMEIVQKLTDTYDVSAEQALKDTKRIIMLLLKKKVISPIEIRISSSKF